ncbi:hypothetical protein E8E15_001017 [Penicillium rubens]|uniref:UPF0648 protein n=1 Tax=Penicillium chrysogenum TaxID=5076 RepID=A0A167T837_PENCH|nr:uncharacterized protein N7525_006670 [Penicillium rubens]KAF3010090.1 hypothetical protein E8E15_001017 [Penicillium rubens]KAJ5049888.1 Protein SABRE [Penicillium rubens]KAJ5828417.1 hypothetical protein N7525_006670 [Penicillium rubens]KZN87987.1 UPF0648 protein [Penicillium chrysogenum]
MTLFNPTSILVGFLLLYLSSFFIFAIVRIATGISIQRIGYFSLRRIAYTPREGIHIEIRGLGFSLHPSSFAQPTWISIRLTELKVTVDSTTLGQGKREVPRDILESPGPPKPPEDRAAPEHDGRSKTWRTLTRIKESVKRLHRQINWLALVDLTAIDTTVHFVNAGQIQVGSLSLSVDTRSKMVERGKLFRRKKDMSRDQRPAEWIMNVKNVLLNVDGREPTEILDNVGVNLHGLLHKDLDGLRDASVALKIGRMHIPYDDLRTLLQRIKPVKSAQGPGNTETDDEMSFADFVDELDKPGSRDDSIVQTVADSKEFASSLLRGIQEIQIALSFFRVSKGIQSLSAGQKPVYLNVVSHELGIDLHRMDPKSPEHRMYFQRKDVAHQALLAAISLSVSLDDESGESDDILYIPMATTTIKTTLPSKTVSAFDDENADERNTNVLFANLVVTSPSVDLQPQHVSRLLKLAQSRASSPRAKKRDNHRLISRLLPKASIKLSVHEPVIRFVLPIEKESGTPDDYNLLISSISSISLDIESSHSSEGGAHYSLSSIYRVASHKFYYQTPAGNKHNLLTNENLELKVHLNATPEVCVIVSGSLNEISVHMIDGEVNRGIREVLQQFITQMQSQKRVPIPANDQKASVLRRVPPWLLQFQFEATGSSVEIAGVDSTVSDISRGVSLQLQSWTAEYKAQKTEKNVGSIARRRTPSHSTIGDESPFRFPPTSPPKATHTQRGASDGRRLALHVRGFDGFVIESEDYLEPEPFFTLPRFEIALSTHSDRLGPILHVTSVFKGIYLQYSLYRFYCLGVAVSVIQDVLTPFPQKHSQSAESKSRAAASISLPPPPAYKWSPKKELVTYDMKATVVQLKANLPNDPQIMIQIYGLAGASQRLSTPYVKANLVRFHAEAPKLKGVWARIGSMNNVRLDFRKMKMKHGNTLVEEKSIDIWTDFIRIGVPHHMVMHRIFDNLINTSKAFKQLHNRFKNGCREFGSKREPEAPKKVPKVSLRSKALLFELEDDGFEWKLGCIYRLGLAEQIQRLAREDAFDLKSHKVRESDQRRATSRLRAKSSHRTLRSERTSQDTRRSRSADERPRSNNQERGRGRKYRYNTDGATCLSSEQKISVDAAWDRLQQYNAQVWKEKIDAALMFQGTSIKQVRNLFSGADEPPPDVKETETILAIPNRPGLMSALISDVNLVIDKPSFPIDEFPSYLNRIGKGMPMSMQYGLVVPMSFNLEMGEARVNLRDYPLDLLHIPALRPGQSPRLPSWSLRTNFVIAEEWRDHESARQVEVELVPASEGPDGSPREAFNIQVWRSVTPVKTYSDPVIEINTSLPTSISWGVSYQPVIQDMMKIIEGFTKPEIDPSERVGFWDKIRLSFHSRIKVLWKEDGDVHLRLKGSRDPYVVTGFGSGFVMCWRRDVRLDVHTSDNPTEFMTVTSGEYVLAIPDYSAEARCANEATTEELDNSSASSEQKNAAHFKKVVMKLSGDVKWAAGLVFERDVDNDERSFSFKPHYEVILKNPKFLKPSERVGYDAYRGFRSDHIHLSVSIIAPQNRDWTVDTVQPSSSYNTIHLTPRFFTHFFNWWSLFSGVMSLPVRQGPLWPGVTKTSKKFNRHLATVKYKILLAPLFVAHIYKHKDREDYAERVVTATGLKVRLDCFKLDIHQRREQIKTQAGGRSKQTRTSAMRINQAQIDMQSADFRAVSASIEGTTPEDVERNRDDILSSFQQPVPSVDLSRFTIPDQNLDWVDMDDFVEPDWILPQESNPRTQILPLAFTPRFTYFRNTDHGDIGPDETGYSTFGHEPTHECVMSETNDPRRVQIELVKDRLATVEAQIRNYERTIGEMELKLMRDVDNNEGLKAEHELFLRQSESLARRRRFLTTTLHRLERHIARDERTPHGDTLGKNVAPSTASFRTGRTGRDADSTTDGRSSGLDGMYSSANDEFSSDFNNRFMIHNVQLKWNNSLRNIVLRYSHQVSQRRGFIYYMSRRAVKFILDIVEEQDRNKRKQPKMSKTHTRSSNNDEDEEEVDERVAQLLNDGKRYVNADGNEPPDSNAQPSPDTQSSPNAQSPSNSDSSSENTMPEFTPQNSYHLRLIAPQIQLLSEKNQKSVLLVAAKGMELKVVSIMDKARVSDDVSGLIRRRFSLEMDGAQFFVATQKKLMANLQFYAGNKYGNAPGSAWPPWLTLEAMFDFELNPFGFSRIVQKTSATLRYDKFNNLRLKYNEEVVKGQQGPHPDDQEDRIDSISVDFPHFRAICDSAEYYSMYIIVLDLMLYSEPLEKVRNERLERIMLTSDFSDLRGVPEMVFKLQARIRQLEEIKEYFQINAKFLDKQGWEDRLALERDLSLCEDELFFMMKAITTSQRRMEPSSSRAAGVHGLLRWSISASEVVWHLMKEPSEPLIEFQLRNASYERTDNADGSNHNLVSIERLFGLNLLPDAIYPQIIAPYLDGARTLDDFMLRVKWHMLEAVAGIPVLDNFEVSLFPLKIQLERELGQKVFEYIFPNVGSSAFEAGGFSPFMIKNMKPLEGSDEEDDDEGSNGAPLTRSTSTDGDTSSMDSLAISKGPGSIELRLQPTLSLSDETKSRNRSGHLKGLVMTPIHQDSNRLGVSETARKTGRPATTGGLSKKKSADSLRMLTKQPTERSLSSHSASEDSRKKFGMVKGPSKGGKSKEPTDDLSQMISRASNFMTLARVKVNDVVLCMSYKGKGEHNLEDLHDFVFRLPVLEYSNKTWSNLDLALRLKKDVIKALISHAPAILGNKFSHHRPSKQQQKRFRELASSSQLLSNTSNLINPSSSQAQSLASYDSNSDYSESRSRKSMQSNASPLARTTSLGSDIHSTNYSDPTIHDARSASEVDVDSRWEASRRFVNAPPPSRPMTSGQTVTTIRADKNDQDDSHIKTIRSIGRKLTFRK